MTRDGWKWLDPGTTAHLRRLRRARDAQGRGELAQDLAAARVVALQVPLREKVR